jgi:hypothetical protein
LPRSYGMICGMSIFTIRENSWSECVRPIKGSLAATFARTIAVSTGSVEKRDFAGRG